MSDNQAVAETVPKQAIKAAGFVVGISEDRNKRCRRTMEDAHACIPDFGDIKRQGFFGIYDGHAGKATAEWCGQNLHEVGILILLNPSSTTSNSIISLLLHALDVSLMSDRQFSSTSL